MTKQQLLVAAAIAGIVSVGTLSTPSFAAKEAKGQCAGVNACKGKGACKTAENECKGKNACKGKGHVEMTEAACTKKGGTFTAATK